jgi:hypothetical protein
MQCAKIERMGIKWVAGALAAICLSGCGACSDDGEQIKQQILAQRDMDAQSGLFPANTDPCNMNQAAAQQLQSRNPTRVAEYAEACKRMRDKGCEMY